MIAYVHTSLRVLEGWFCVVVLRACVRYSSRRCAVACPRCCVVVLRYSSRVLAFVFARVLRCCVGACVWGAALVCAAPPLVCCGGFLLSHTPWGAVPLARPGLASRFGMLLGVSPVL